MEDADLDLDAEEELFAGMDSREALHAWRPSEESQNPPREETRAKSSPAAYAPVLARTMLDQSLPSPSITPSRLSERSSTSSSPRQSSGTTTLLADMIANAPRPNLPDSELAKQAALKASSVIRNNPKLRGDALMEALRRAETDAVIEFNALKEERRVAQATVHHNITGGLLHSGRLDKKSGGRRNSMEVSVGTWRTRWFVLKSSCLAYYMNDEEDQPRDVLLFDQSFRVIREKYGSHGFEVQTTSRSLHLRASTVEECDVWCAKIAAMMRTSMFCQAHVHSSFAPMRDVAMCSALICADDYFKAVLTSLDLAASEIFIAGWWINIDIKLRRGSGENEVTLRDALTAAACDRNVKIYVMLYKEQAVAMPNNSAHAEEQLKAINSENIFVLRHPHVLDVAATLWSHHEKLVVVDRRVAFVGGIDLAPGRWDVSSHECVCANEEEREIKLPGIDYWNPRAGDFKPHLCGAKAWTTDSFNVKMHPKMGWHDLAVVMSGVEVVSDISRHFVQRWLHHRSDMVKTDKTTPPLIPYTEGVVNASGGPYLSCQGIIRKVEEGGAKGLAFSNCSKCVAQVLRSSGQWSLGVKCERSVYNCMLRLIETSEKLIYIENQYFVAGFGTMGEDYDEEIMKSSVVEGDEQGEGSNTSPAKGSDDGLVLNGIGLALFARISRAVLGGETFKVIVVLPHLAWEHNSVQSTILHCQNEAIRDLLERLGDLFPEVGDWGEYISFYNLRKWGHLEGKGFVMEEIYLHDKLMIVDDRTVLVGSANVNDRSLLGTRDSEVAVLLHDANTVRTKMDGEEWEAGEFAYSLRCRLWREHLGLMQEREGFGPEVVKDPVGIGFETWRFVSTANRKIYESCFVDMYRDEYKRVKSVPGMSGGKGSWDCNAASEEEEEDGGALNNVQGHLVAGAPYFLSEHNLLPKVGQKAKLMPLRMFV